MAFRAMVAVTVLLLMGSLAHAEMRVTRNVIGCQTRATFDKVVRLQIDGDMEALKKFLVVPFIAGECTVFKAGDTVSVEDVKIFGGVVCMRPRGEPTCFWTYSNAVK